MKEGEEGKAGAWLKALVEELKARQYRPNAVLRVFIPKADGKLRPLGMPTVKDRVAQAAAALVLMPIFEADMHEHSYACRPGRNCASGNGSDQKGDRSGAV